MEIFQLTKGFPAEERYSLVDQMRRSSRSVCANIAGACRERRYAKHFVSKLNDAAREADETRVWLDFSVRCRYISRETMEDIDAKYDLILAQLAKMASNPQDWTVR
jgi:four helix bundle protein